MSVSFPKTKETTGHPSPKIRSRFETCLNLTDGMPAFPVSRVDPLFEEQAVSFGVVANTPASATASAWLFEAIQRLAISASELELAYRPIHVPVPMAIFGDRRAADRAAQAAMSVGFCTQEFILEFQDATLANGEKETFDALDEFRRKGFRIGLDARKSAMTPFSTRIRSAIERLRLTAADLVYDEMLQLRADIVCCIGGEVILDRATWQQTEELMRLGATHSLRLVTDA